MDPTAELRTRQPYDGEGAEGTRGEGAHAERGPPISQIALVLSGGGAKGAMQVALYRVLRELGVPIHRVVGSSVGAINGAFIAAGVPPRRLGAAWADLRRRDVFAFRWSLLWRHLGAESLYSERRLRRLLETHLPVQTFEELRIPLTVVATDLDEGTPVLLESGPLVPALLASCAVPGLLPPLTLPDGRRCIDGALADNMPIQIADAKGASAIFSIVCRACDRCGMRRGLASILGQAFGLAVDARFRQEADALRQRDDLCIIEGDLGLDVPALDFGHGEELMRRAYTLAKPHIVEWLRRHPNIPRRPRVPSARRSAFASPADPSQVLEAPTERGHDGPHTLPAR